MRLVEETVGINVRISLMVDRRRLDAVGVGNDVKGVARSRRSNFNVIKILVDGGRARAIVQKRFAVVSNRGVDTRGHIGLVDHANAVDPKGNRDDEEEDEDSEADENSLEPVGDGDLGRVVHIIHTLTNPRLVAFNVAVADGVGGIAENILSDISQVGRSSSSVVAENLLVFEIVGRFVAVYSTSRVEGSVRVEGIRLEFELGANLQSQPKNAKLLVKWFISLLEFEWQAYSSESSGSLFGPVGSES